MIAPCPNCKARGIYSDDERAVCLYCGHVADDPVGLTERMASNATPEDGWGFREHGAAKGARQPGDLDEIIRRAWALAGRTT